VTADLTIGAADGSETYVQIGTQSHPQETLVLLGNLTICPYFFFAEKPGAKWWEQPERINRLAVGDRAAQRRLQTAPALVLDNTKILAVGERDAVGGQLHVYNGRVTALRPEKDPRIPPNRVKHSFFGTTVLRGATVSWLPGQLYGLQHPKAVLEDCLAFLLSMTTRSTSTTPRRLPWRMKIRYDGLSLRTLGAIFNNFYEPKPPKKCEVVRVSDLIHWDCVAIRRIIQEKLGWKSPREESKVPHLRFDCDLMCFKNAGALKVMGGTFHAMYCKWWVENGDFTEEEAAADYQYFNDPERNKRLVEALVQRVLEQ
jgi:hypothetical protein